jgi:hypothetical protein
MRFDAISTNLIAPIQPANRWSTGRIRSQKVVITDCSHVNKHAPVPGLEFGSVRSPPNLAQNADTFLEFVNPLRHFCGARPRERQRIASRLPQSIQEGYVNLFPVPEDRIGESQKPIQSLKTSAD